jgi:hypothetical protein
MATEIGTGTSYPITVPVGSDNADIQTALRYITYGIGGTPTSDSQITSNSIFGKIKLLAPKASPIFTGNGSIAGNFSIGGNLIVSGTIDNDQGTNATFKDKTLTIGSANTTDADADENGIILKGATDKKIIFQNGTGWESTENLNLDSGKTFKIAGTTVLSGTQVLGKTIGGTSAGDIVSIDGTQTLTNKTITTVKTGSAGDGLVQAPQMVFSLANSAGANGSTPINIFASGNDVLSSLEAAKLYRFRAKYFFNFNYAGSQMVPNILFNFSNAPTAIKWSFKTYPQGGGTALSGVGASTAVNATNILSVNASASNSWVVEIDGYFTTHATLSSTLTPQASTPAPVSGPGFIFTAGSWFEVQKIGTSTQTNIAGNWA